MDKQNAKSIISSRKAIAVAGQYQLRVVSAVPHVRTDGSAVTILNFNAMTPYQIEQAMKEFKAGNYQEATNFALSTNARAGKDFTPAKGQIVNVVVETYTNKDGIEALGVVSVSPLETKAAAAIDFSAFDEEEAEDEVTEESDDLTAEAEEAEETEAEQAEGAII